MSDPIAALPPTAEVALLAAFTKDGTGGNPAGVVLDAAGLTHEQRQRIATTVGVSETAFVETLGDGVFAVAFYTPSAQVPDCGHATVATFALLAQQGLLTGGRATKRTIIGDRAIALEGERVFMEQPRPAISPFARRAQLAAALGLSVDAIPSEPVVADHGVRFMLIETSRDALAAARPDQAAIEALTAQADAIGMYVYARDRPGYDATVRMFAPRYGIPEESATGMAAGLLGGYLARDAREATFRFVQGEFPPLDAASELIVRVHADRTTVGGSAHLLRTLQVAPEG